jgi:ubiquinone/menaquinone biosynthesis C-methylase UbiE
MGQQEEGQGQFVSGQFDSAAEVARITKRQQLITDNIGGLFHERSDLASINHVLDIACGPGVWALEVAFAHPQIQVTGIDASRTNVRYAQAQAQAQSLVNVDFQAMDVVQGLSFDDHTFDLVNAKFIDDRIPINAWPAVLQSCQRVLRPGGTMRITTSELTVTNSKAYEELLRLYTLALYKAGYCVSGNGYHTGTGAMLNWTLGQVGYQRVQRCAYVIDYSHGTKASEENYANLAVQMQLNKQFLMDMEVVTDDHFEALYHEATIDLLSSNYCSMWYFLTMWGETPEATI